MTALPRACSIVTGVKSPEPEDSSVGVSGLQALAVSASAMIVPAAMVRRTKLSDIPALSSGWPELGRNFDKDSLT